MKQTIAELGSGGEGWIVYNDGIRPPYATKVLILNVLESTGTLMPKYSANILVNYSKDGNNFFAPKTVELFANDIIYTTKEEADKVAFDQLAETKPLTTKEVTKEKTDWKQVRINASISILNSLLETTQHSVTEEIVINDIYARTAIAYADTLIKELKKTEDDFEKLLEL